MTIHLRADDFLGSSSPSSFDTLVPAGPSPGTWSVLCTLGASEVGAEVSPASVCACELRLRMMIFLDAPPAGVTGCVLPFARYASMSAISAPYEG